MAFTARRKPCISPVWAVARGSTADDTPARVNGVNEHTHTVCNTLYAVYVTTAKKDYLVVLQVFTNGHALTFRFNAEAYSWLKPIKLSVGSGIG